MFRLATSTDLSSQEVSDLLQKLLTESTRLKAVLTCTVTGRGLPMAVVVGTLLPGPEEMLTVTAREGTDPDAPFLVFNPNSAIIVRYGDHRLFPVQPPGFSLGAALFFQYTGQVNLTLFEIA
jgi:hypothetical protein